ncbi:hypothetical protein [Novacetimonas hansenii]|uniref:Uncharacterized protein n=1 Tax=Novacetimonas hansenii TaxID=436 RepID=A0AAW5ESU0_NOVHA|nr:hypothetical protein [Novacetimonas hansenii]MCJ8353847.1 hypothetical protein [Novacetimonas hansenii]
MTALLYPEGKEHAPRAGGGSGVFIKTSVFPGFPQKRTSLDQQCGKTDAKRLFENTLLIENRESFWVPPFERKRRRLLKLFRKSFTKNFYNFNMLSSLTFQTGSDLS